MKKVIAALIAVLVVISAGSLYYIYNNVPENMLIEAKNRIIKLDKKNKEFYVFQNNNFIASFKIKEDAIDFAKQLSQSYVTQEGENKWIWDNYPQFSVYVNENEYLFKSITESLNYARDKSNAYILNRANKARIWSSADRLPQRHIIQNVPLINQKPELSRGCEVTALAMLLNYYGTGVSKLALAEQIKKDPTPYSVDKNGVITFGNPAYGFVGDIYDLSKPGLGVYHEPIFLLLKEYIGADALDLTGARFSDLYFFISKNKPVLVITNATFKPLEREQFQKWNTEQGEILVTNYEHSVLIKGYDEEFIYFNNPLNDTGMEKAEKDDFIKAWQQMGSQAVTYFE